VYVRIPAQKKGTACSVAVSLRATWNFKIRI
jgi:hypothetical protein